MQQTRYWCLNEVHLLHTVHVGKFLEFDHFPTTVQTPSCFVCAIHFIQGCLLRCGYHLCASVFAIHSISCVFFCVALVVVVCIIAMRNVDTSMVYHMVRGQSFIKLYVIINVLEVSVCVHACVRACLCMRACVCVCVCVCV